MTRDTATNMLYEASIEFLRAWDNESLGVDEVALEAINAMREAVAAAHEAGIGAP